MIPPPLDTALGKALRSLRLERGLTQQQLAKQSTVPRSTLSKYERGTRSVYIGDLYRIAEVLGVKPEEIVRTIGGSSSSSSLRSKPRPYNGDKMVL